MSRIDGNNHGLVNRQGRPMIRPTEKLCSTLVAADVPPDDAWSGPDTSGVSTGIGAEVGESSSGDRAGETSRRRTDFGTDTPMPTPTPWQPDPPHPSERPADSWPTIDSDGNLKLNEVIFGRYLVKEKLGSGGMGSVWLVQHTKLGCNRALKIIVPLGARSSGSLALFEREARLSAQLNDHPNIADVHDADSREDRAYIEMEYVQGRSLDKILAAETQQGRTMPLDWTARILGQLCDLLQVAHDKGIIHRDLKPSNLMLLDGRPAGREHLKVLDFGIAKDVAGDPGNAYTIQGFSGTLPYASPEQAEGRAERASDIYSVGVILYELLTGRLPFAGSFLVQLAAKMTSIPPAFREVNPEANVPAAVESLILRCLDKDPSRRPRSARELSDAFLAALPTQVQIGPLPPPTTPGTVTELVVQKPPGGWRRRKRAVLVGSLMGLGLALGSTLFAISRWQGDKPALPEGFEVPPGVAKRGDRAAILVHKDSRARFILLPSGRFAMGSSEETNPNEDEKPAHFVYLNPYYLQETEVTFGQMEQFFETHRDVERPVDYLGVLNDLKAKCSPSDEALEHPAVYVSRELAVQFAGAMGGRLPTEAEYEYAARSGGKPYTFVWGDDQNAYWNEDPERKANLQSEGTKPVGRCAADRTEQGIFDLTGNVREWCHDIWSRYSDVAVHDPMGPPATNSKADQYSIRGGSFVTPPNVGIRVSSRSSPMPRTSSEDDLGFRVALPLGP